MKMLNDVNTQSVMLTTVRFVCDRYIRYVTFESFDHLYPDYQLHLQASTFRVLLLKGIVNFSILETTTTHLEGLSTYKYLPAKGGLVLYGCAYANQIRPLDFSSFFTIHLLENANYSISLLLFPC